MQQYYSIKEQHPDSLLLFRMGDFYETFEDDALKASNILDIVLTKRSNGAAQSVPLAGFPYHALERHLPKLVQAGLRVAICEQLESPKNTRTIVQRGVVEIVTPGVSFHDQLLNPNHPNYLAAVHWGSEQGAQASVGLAFIDASTGEFSISETHASALDDALQNIGPAELLVDRRLRENLDGLKARDFVVTPQEDWVFSFDFAYQTLLDHFKTHSLKGFGVEELRNGIVAAGAVLHYLGETQKGRLPHIQRITRGAGDGFMLLDPQTKRNLELVASLREGRQDGTLIQIMDKTRTAMGARRLRKWLVRPLRSVEHINRRLDAVEELFREQALRGEARDLLRVIRDLARIVARVCTGRASPRDLAGLGLSLEQIPPLKTLLQTSPCVTLRDLAERLDPCSKVTGEISAALAEDPPATTQGGDIFRDGYHAELDRLRALARSGKDFVARLQKTESERTGIASLKVGFNKVFGYYLEITNSNKDKVPDHYIRKQTLVNAERYITPELKEYEETILGAEEQIARLEGDLFRDLRETIALEAPALQQSGSLLSTLDCYCSFAEVAARGGYCRPLVDDSLRLRIEEGRHPVVERTVPPGEVFIPNSIDLDPKSGQIFIITGPNMAGKSVVLRQVGLIVLLAQAGSFVPAKSARIGVADRIFTRVGASDNLAEGESTFLVEMNETANILHNATPRSLILLDEVGRGTSTFDGLSIAWALVEHLHDTSTVAARTLFATHYHELNELTDRFERVRNFRIQVQEHDGKIIFLRKMLPGGADHSYGIEVARMAGLPASIITRARGILTQLESQHLAVEADAKAEAPGVPPDVQMSLFPMTPVDELSQRLSAIDPDRMTPLEALVTLAELKGLLGGGSA